MHKSDIFFLLLIASIPIQLNKFFFQDFSYVLGIPIDYRAVSIYASDLIILSYLTFFLIENYKKLEKIILPQKNFVLILTLFNFYLFLNSIFISESKEASIWFTAKIFLFSLTTIAALFTLTKSKVQNNLSSVLAFSLLWQSIVLTLQFVLQRSLGLWFLGERSFDASTVSIAHVQIFGIQFLRPYGTFPHPNVAAAFLIIALVITWNLKSKITNLITLFALFLTGSKTALVVLGTAAVLLKSKYIWIVLIIAPALIWLFLNSITDPQVASIAERLVLAQAALDITAKNPILGVGANNFILELSKLDISSLAQIRLLQPVHNVFLLILAENGLIGLLLFAALLLTALRNARSPNKLALFIALLIFASVDHFFWTLHQGQLLFWLSISYILSESDRIKKSNINGTR